MIKGLIPEEGITVLNVRILDERAPKYVKQNLIEQKGKTDQPIISVRILTFLSQVIDTATKLTVSKHIEDLNNSVNQLDLIGIIEHSAAECMFFSVHMEYLLR